VSADFFKPRFKELLRKLVLLSTKIISSLVESSCSSKREVINPIRNAKPSKTAIVYEYRFSAQELVITMDETVTGINTNLLLPESDVKSVIFTRFLAAIFTSDYITNREVVIRTETDISGIFEKDVFESKGA
jgi:hypothetical protein